MKAVTYITTCHRRGQHQGPRPSSPTDFPSKRIYKSEATGDQPLPCQAGRSAFPRKPHPAASEPRPANYPDHYLSSLLAGLSFMCSSLGDGSEGCVPKLG